MGGKLDVSVNYDSTTITMVGKAAEFEQIVEVCATLCGDAVTPEIVHACATHGSRAARHDDRPATSLTARLPVGFRRFSVRTSCLARLKIWRRVERADLMLARERF